MLVDLSFNAIDTNTYVEPKKITLAEYLRRWLERRKKRLAPHTFCGYQVNVEKHIIPYIGNITLDKLRAADIDDLFSDILVDKGLSGTTQLYVFRTLNKALNDAVRR